MTNQDVPRKYSMELGTAIEAIEGELDLEAAMDVVATTTTPAPVPDTAVPFKRKKGKRRDTEDRWLDEAENMIKRGEAEDNKWLDDAERDVETIMAVQNRRGPGSRRRPSALGLKLSPIRKDDKEKEHEEAQAGVKDAEAAIEAAEEVHGENSEEVANTLLEAVDVYNRARQFARAELCSRRALSLFEQSQGAYSCQAVTTLLRLIHVCALQGNWLEVEKVCSQGIAVVTTAPKLSPAMKDLVDQISVVARVKCSLQRLSARTKDSSKAFS